MGSGSNNQLNGAIMEKITKLQKKDLYMEKGYYVELECCMCTRHQLFTGNTESQIIKEIKEEGWRKLNSDQYQLIGDWCGCDYREWK